MSAANKGYGVNENGCNLFEPVITNAGVCHSFNPTPSADLLATSYFKDSFVSAFGPDLNSNSKILHGKGSGRKNGIEFYIFTPSTGEAEMKKKVGKHLC